ncbi:MAG: C39 family peptidase [Coriobacteriales bacterium]|jgi:uncharacterized protein YvpB|nr:C39 family peptidase [Coriobacteriales bacterium]
MSGFAFRYLGSVALTIVMLACAVGLTKVDEQEQLAFGRQLWQVPMDSPAPLIARGLDALVDGADRDLLRAHETAKNEAAAGWRTEGGERHYYLSDGSQVTGSIAVGGATLTFDERGAWQSTRLDVPHISQLPEMPFGCEVVSVTMMLNHAGVKVDKDEVAAQLPFSNDPNTGFTGSVYGLGPYDPGGIVWPPALLGLVRDFGQDPVDLTGRSWEDLCDSLDQGRPVCVWFRTAGLDHTVLLVGYSDSLVWLNDPLGEKDSPLEIETFLACWSENDARALSYR